MKRDKGILLSPQFGVNPSVMLCFWCGESVGVAMLGKLKGDEQAPRQGIYDHNPCDKCAATMAKGITFLEVDDVTHEYTSRYAVISEEGFIAQTKEPEIRDPILKARKCLCLHSDFIQIFKGAFDDHSK